MQSHISRNTGHTTCRIGRATRTLSFSEGNLPAPRKLAGFFLCMMSVVFSASATDIFYVAEEQLTRVSIIQNGHPTPFANGAGLVYGLTVDGSGNVYAAGTGDDTIRKITPNGTVSVYASDSSLGSPNGMTFDSSGNLYTTGYGWGGTVNRITPNGAVTRVANVGGMDVAFDANGNMYVSSGSAIDRITPLGNISTFASGFQLTWGLAFDQAGNLFVGDYFGNSISKVTPRRCR